MVIVSIRFVTLSIREPAATGRAVTVMSFAHALLFLGGGASTNILLVIPSPLSLCLTIRNKRPNIVPMVTPPIAPAAA